MFSIIQDSVRVHYDSQSAIHLAKDHRYYKRAKHIDVRYHKIRHWCWNLDFDNNNCDTDALELYLKS